MNEETELPKWSELLRYFKCLEQAGKSWTNFLVGRDIGLFREKNVLQWLQTIDHTFTALKMNYVFDELETLPIEAHASGFPQQYSIRLISERCKNIRSESVTHGASSVDLKEAFLDRLFSTGEVNEGLLERVSKARVIELLRDKEVLRLYGPLKMERVEAMNGKRTYVCSWSRYGYKNLPTLYTMMFECDIDLESEGDKLLVVLNKVLCEETSQMPLLSQLGGRIDYALAEIHPKWIGRIILGPVFVPHITKDENPLQQALDTTPVSESRDRSVSRIIYEYVLTKGETEVSRSLFDPQGRRHEVLQEFGVRQTDKECDARGVTYVSKTLFAPHTLVRNFDPGYRKEISHELVGVDQ